MPLVRRLSRRLPPSLIQFRAHLPPLFNLCLSIHEMKAFSNFNYGLSPAGAPPKLGHNGEQLWGVGQRHFHRQLARGPLSSQVNIWQTYTWDIFIYIYILCLSLTATQVIALRNHWRSGCAKGGDGLRLC